MICGEPRSGVRTRFLSVSFFRNPAPLCLAVHRNTHAYCRLLMFLEHVHSSRVLAFSYSTVYQSSARARIFVYGRQTLYRGCFLDKVVSLRRRVGLKLCPFCSPCPGVEALFSLVLCNISCLCTCSDFSVRIAPGVSFSFAFFF